MNFENLLKNKSTEIACNFKFKNELNFADKTYCNFMEMSNGGYFFEDSFMIYSESSKIYSLVDINLFFMEKYNFLSKDYFPFAQDIFGNQYCFFQKEIILFFIESSDIEIVAKNFDDFIIKVILDPNYYCGLDIMLKWKENEKRIIQKAERLCPKKPFIIGGSYEIENFYTLEIFDNLSFNSNIANQIYNLPDKTQINFKLI